MEPMNKEKTTVKSKAGQVAMVVLMWQCLVKKWISKEGLDST